MPKILESSSGYRSLYEDLIFKKGNYSIVQLFSSLNTAKELDLPHNALHEAP